VTLDDKALDLIFVKARTQNGWLRRRSPTISCGDLPDPSVRPDERQTRARREFSSSNTKRRRLLPALTPGNVDRPRPRRSPRSSATTRASTSFSRSSSHTARDEEPVRASAKLAETVAFRNGTLQAPTSCSPRVPSGLDVGGMSGFDNAKVDASSSRTVA